DLRRPEQLLEVRPDVRDVDPRPRPHRAVLPRLPALPRRGRVDLRAQGMSVSSRANSTPKAPSAVPQQVAAMALVGVLVFVASLPVVTLLAAGAAGAQSLREQATLDREPRVRRFLALYAAALRDPVGVLAVVAVLAVGVLDLLAVLGGVPGAAVVGPVLA